MSADTNFMNLALALGRRGLGTTWPGGGRGAGEGGEGGENSEDAFRFVLTREEFLELFLEDLELPDLAKRRLPI
ncbi:DUF444 family protein [Methylobacterium oryzae]|uniref:DUF444 family protein n=1 Tax=Methylobacterium oryzae TaxID=334852 RepID=UPI003AF6A25D